jgi:hypothetical protein
MSGKKNSKRKRWTDEEYTAFLVEILVEDIVMENSAEAKSILFGWQPAELANAAIAAYRAVTPERLLMGGAS